MRCAVDLHIHSCLSPCGDALMTPNNIVNMARLKGLDMIAVADHNSARNLPAVAAVARAAGLPLLPALELTTAEEAHLLAYFRSVECAVAFSDMIYPHLPDTANVPAIFGAQTVLSAEDQPIDEVDKLLISALDISVDALARRIVEMGGLAVPAHINRPGNGILAALGFIPPGVPFAALEIKKGLPLPHQGLPELPFLYASDAHRLEDILERVEFLELDAPSPDAFFRWLGG